MALMKKILLVSILILTSVCIAHESYASAMIAKPVAEIQVVDKITSHRFTIYARINEYVRFQTMKISVKACYINNPTQVTEAEAYFVILDHPREHDEYKAFEGWMFASTPSIVALKHPVYDVTIINCIDKIPKGDKIIE